MSPGAAPALVFDLDGTLTDPREGIEGCVRLAMERLGRPLPAGGDLRWMIGPPLRESFSRLLGSPAEVEKALALYRERYASQGLYENRVIPGIPEALEALERAGAPLYVATSKPADFAREILKYFGLAARFRGVHGSGHDGSLADKSELLKRLLEVEGLDPARAWMVGDREHDIRGARANALAGAGVAWGYGSREELLAAGARVVLENPGQLPDLLD